MHHKFRTSSSTLYVHFVYVNCAIPRRQTELCTEILRRIKEESREITLLHSVRVHRIFWRKNIRDAKY